MSFIEVTYFATLFALISLVTPCVFPMIPLTTGFFLKKAEKNSLIPIKDSLIYMMGIISSFVVLGVLVTLLLGASGLNRISTDPIINLALAILFFLFALNLLGIYEIQLPSKFINLFSNYSSKSNFLVTFTMGVIFTLTTFTCTMPFIGNLLIFVSKGELIYPIFGMFIFGFVFSVPFFLLTMMPNVLKKFQNIKQKNWLSLIKPFVGFLELIFVLKFLSNIDLVYNWELLTRDIFLVISILFSTMGIIYFIVIYFKQKLHTSLYFIVFFILINLLLGFSFKHTIWQDLNSFLPPKNYAQYQNTPNQIHWYSDLEQAKKIAKKENKLLFIDFTGYTCTNCRFMEENIFTIPKIKNQLNQYVLVQLYIDGIGHEYDRNLDYLEEKFETVSIPFYAILDHKEKIKHTWLGMTRNPEEFYKFILIQQKNV